MKLPSARTVTERVKCVPLRLLCGLVLVAGMMSAAETAKLAPAKNWALPLFTREGYHSMTARGSQAEIASAQRIEVIDLNLTVFSGDATDRVETVLLSPAATFLPDQNTARGEAGVRVVRDDLDAKGIHWVYDHAQKKVSLRGQVQIVLNAQMKDLLR